MPTSGPIELTIRMRRARLPFAVRLPRCNYVLVNHLLFSLPAKAGRFFQLDRQQTQPRVVLADTRGTVMLTTTTATAFLASCQLTRLCRTDCQPARARRIFDRPDGRRLCLTPPASTCRKSNMRRSTREYAGRSRIARGHCNPTRTREKLYL